MGRWRRWPCPAAPATAVLALCAALAAAGGCTVRARPEPTATSRAAAPLTTTTATATLGAAIRGTTVATRPFPSRQRTIPKGTPLVVDVRATDFGQQLFEARIAPLADPETAPHLRWVAARDCPITG